MNSRKEKAKEIFKWLSIYFRWNSEHKVLQKLMIVDENNQDDFKRDEEGYKIN